MFVFGSRLVMVIGVFSRVVGGLVCSWVIVLVMIDRLLICRYIWLVM